MHSTPLLVLMVYGPVGCEVDECSFPEREWDSVRQCGLLGEHFQGAKLTIAISTSTGAAQAAPFSRQNAFFWSPRRLAHAKILIGIGVKVKVPSKYGPSVCDVWWSHIMPVCMELSQ